MPLWTLPSRRSTTWSVPTVTNSAINGTTITAGATPHVKTAWTQLTASTGSSDWLGFWFYYDTTAVSAVDSSMLLDIGIGTNPNEVAIVNNLALGYASGGFITNVIWFPLYIPSGTRVVARLQSAIASAAEKVTVVGNASGHGLISDNDLYGYCTTYGANAGTSRGVTATTGTADNYGTPVELTVPGTGLTAPIHAALIRFQGAGVTVMNNTNMRYALCGGVSGSEVARTSDFYFTQSSAESCEPRGPGANTTPIEGLSIPTGERMSVKAACHNASQTADFTVIGFTR